MPAKNVLSIARSFIGQYYKMMAECPEELHKFYKEQSDFVHPTSDNVAEETNVHGDQNIRETVKNLNLAGTRFDLTNGHLDAQPSENDSVLLVVTGLVSAPGSTASQPFIQTFLLAPQAVQEQKKSSYFVRNSIFRLIGAPVTSAAVTLAAVTPAAPTPAIPAAQQPASTESLPAKKVVEVAAPAPAVEAVTAAPATAPAAPVSEPVKASEATKEAAAPVVADGAKTYASLFRSSDKPSSATAAPATIARTASKPSTATTASSGDTAAAAPATGKGKKSESSKADQKSAPTPSIYVNHLEEGTSKDNLIKIFSKYGKIEKIDLHDNRGYAFIEYAAPDGVKRAIDAYGADESIFFINGKPIGVEEKKGDKAKKEKPSSSSSSQRNGGGQSNGRGATDKPRSGGGDKGKGGSKNAEGK